MLPHDVARCAGRAPFSGDTCPRKNDCARYLEQSGPRSPFYLSVCEESDAFIHAESLKAEPAQDHPKSSSPTRVLDGQSLRTGGESA